MPVLPDDGSISVAPGVSTPRFSASSIIERAIRSFTEPPGFMPSSLTRIRTSGFGLSAETSTIGVFPIRSRTLGATPRSRPRDQLTARRRPPAGSRRRRPAPTLVSSLLEVADVVVVQVDVHETVQRAVVGEHLAGQPRVGRLRGAQHLTDRRALDAHRWSCPSAAGRSRVGRRTSTDTDLRRRPRQWRSCHVEF